MYYYFIQKKKGKLINVPAFKPPSAAAGGRDAPLEMSSSFSNGNLEHLSGSSSSHETNEKKPKEADRKSTISVSLSFFISLVKEPFIH